MKKTIISLMLLAIGTTSTMAQGLKDAYKDYFTIGVAVNSRNVTDAAQMELIKKRFYLLPFMVIQGLQGHKVLKENKVYKVYKEYRVKKVNKAYKEKKEMQEQTERQVISTSNIPK